MTTQKDQQFEKKQQIFGHLFLIANRLQTMIDRDFAPHGFTAKQWFLMAAVGDLGEPPTLSQVAHHMGTSHQNAKQLALRLVENGYLRLFTDQADRRIKRLALTEKTQAFWAERSQEDLAFFDYLFGSFSIHEIDLLDDCLRRMALLLREME